MDKTLTPLQEPAFDVRSTPRPARSEPLMAPPAPQPVKRREPVSTMSGWRSSRWDADKRGWKGWPVLAIGAAAAAVVLTINHEANSPTAERAAIAAAAGPAGVIEREPTAAGAQAPADGSAVTPPTSEATPPLTAPASPAPEAPLAPAAVKQAPAPATAAPAQRNTPRSLAPAEPSLPPTNTAPADEPRRQVPPAVTPMPPLEPLTPPAAIAPPPVVTPAPATPPVDSAAPPAVTPAPESPAPAPEKTPAE